MAIPVAVVAAWMSVVERLAALWAKWRKPKSPAPPGDPTGTAPVTPPAPGGDTVVIGGKTYRRRPGGVPEALLVAALAGWALAGCAGPLQSLDGKELLEVCQAIVPPPAPCEPCPSAPAPPQPAPTPPPDPTPPPKPPTPPAAPGGPEAPVPPSDNADKPEGVLLSPPAKCAPDAGQWLIDAADGKCGRWAGRLAGRGWEPRAWPGTVGGTYHYITKYGAEPETGTEFAVFTSGKGKGRTAIWAGYFAGENRARTCTFKIKTAGGETSVTVNQHEGRTSYGPRWVKLGAWKDVRSVTLVNGPDHSESIDGLAVVQEK